MITSRTHAIPQFVKVTSQISLICTYALPLYKTLHKGKTFLPKCIAYAATQNGVKTLFTTAMDMINQLVAAESDHTMLKKLQFYQSQDLLVCDELCKALHNSSYDKLNIM
ncbi:ATP-binding protein [Desulfotignum balticum]|uniref:ATP-binding protein n=1 Tax=Desulfotignum balticum TaxID=115781 RepID=UPI001B7FAE81|nr:ATP-binding protein [Desulfotignum balticum]